MQLSAISLALTRAGLIDRFRAASLDLLFTSSTQALDPRITFTRSSNATVVGSDGTLQYAPHNLLTYSEQFDNVAWVKASGSVTDANVAIDPQGFMTADKFSVGTSTFPQITQSVTTVVTTTHTGSVYFKAAGLNFVQLCVRDTATQTNFFRTILNLADGAITQTLAGGNGTIANVSVQNAGNGWWRVGITGVANTSGTSLQVVVILAKDANGTVATPTNSAATDGIYIWGAQLNVGSLQPYYPTTVKNLLGYTQEFDNAAWAKSNSSVTPNVTTAPDGSLSADLFSGNGVGAAYLYAPYSATVGTPFRLSCYVKNFNISGSATVWLRDFTDAGLAAFNLTTGTVNTTTGTASDANIVPVGDGWFRVSAKFTPTVSGTHNISPVHIAVGNTTTGFYAWGAQLSDSASLDPYVYNPGAAPAASAYYGPRFDYDPVTLQPKGLLIEEQRTNIWVYSEDMSKAGGWGFANATATSNSTTAPDGTSNAGTFTVTANGAATAISTGATISAGATVTHSQYIKKSVGADWVYLALRAPDFNHEAGVFINISTGQIGTGTVLAGTQCAYVSNSATATPVGNGWYRISASFSTNTATSVVGSLRAARSNGSTSGPLAGDAYFLWGRQGEVGAFATSYIPTTTAAATRAADIATMTGTNFSSWYNQTAGSFFFDYNAIGPRGVSGFSVSVVGSASPGANYLGFAYNGVVTNAGSTYWRNGGVGAITPTVNYDYGGYRKYGVSFDNTRALVVSVDGAISATATSSTDLPTVDTLNIGRRDGSNFPTSLWLRRIAYFPRRLSNDELQAITA